MIPEVGGPLELLTFELWLLKKMLFDTDFIFFMTFPFPAFSPSVPTA